jgi:arsenite methyltransferase
MSSGTPASATASARFPAAFVAGPAGGVVGIDMTGAQLATARRLARESGFGNVEFGARYIEQPPVDAASRN